jgi:iron complex outermembrane receptor protein
MKTINCAAASLTGLGLVLAAAAPAYAQQANTSDEIIVTAQQKQKQVTSNGDLGALGTKSALETPFNVTSYTAQLVLDQQSETIGDVLENEPSVRTTYGSGNQSELFVIRGFALNGDDVAIDGLYGVTPRQIVSPELYESIQVLNGANAFLFGAAPGGSGIGGGINLIPKRAQKTLLRATASYGADSVFGGNFDIGTRFGGEQEFGIRINGVYRNGETAIDDERRGVRVVGASFDVRKGPGRFFLDFGYEDQRAYQPRPEIRLANTSLAIPTVPDANANYAQPWSFTKLRDIYTLARIELDITDKVMAYVAGGFRDGREDGDYSTLTVTNSTTGASTQSRLFVPREDNNESGKIGLRGRFAFAGISNEVNVGASVNFTQNRNAFAFGSFPTGVRGCGAAVSAFCTNLYAPVMVAKPANGTVGGDLDNVPIVAESAFRSAFLSDTIGLLDDKILVTLGARRQSMIVEGYDRATLRRTTRYNDTVTTPVVGVIVRPTENLSFYGNRIEGLAQGPTAPTTANTLNPGQIFPPFRSKQYEVGAKYAVKGLTATLAFYQTRQPNAYSKSTPTTANPLAMTYVVEGEQRNRGIELSLNGEPTDYLRFIGGITVTDARLTRTLNGATDGNKAIGVPDYQVNFGVEVVPPFLKKATLTGRVVRTGTQYLDVTNLQKLQTWTRFDLGIRYVAVAAGHPMTFEY